MLFWRGFAEDAAVDCELAIVIDESANLARQNASQEDVFAICARVGVSARPLRRSGCLADTKANAVI